MASEVQLRRRIHELQLQIQSLRHQKEIFEKKMSRQMDDRFVALKTEYERAFVRQKNETEELYTARIREFQEQIIREAQQQYKALEKESARISKMQAAKMTELYECNEELRGILHHMKAQLEMADENHRRHAVSLLEQLQEKRALACAMPHEFFFRGEFDIIDSHARQIAEEMDQEMYQAAAADASSVMMEFDLLKTKVEQAFHEWMMAFQDYARIVRGIEVRIGLLEERQLQTAAGTFIMDPHELDFWSSGMYLPYKHKIQQALSMIAEVEEKGAVDYLKSQDKKRQKSVFSKVTEAHKWDDELTGIINCILSERTLSDERWAVARDVSKKLEEIGYSAIRKRYREPETSLEKREWYPKGKKYRQNPLDCYDLIETIQGMDLVHIIFVPVRSNGVAVRNECIVSMTAKGLKSSRLTSEVIETNVRRVKEIAQHIDVSGIVDVGDQRERIASEEQRRKKEPNPKEQIRYLERKYQ